MTTRRTRRQNTTVRPRPRVYEPLLRAHDSNTSNARETLVHPSKGKRLRVLRVRVIQEVADGRRLYEVYFGEGETIASAPGKAVDTLDIPELGEEATRVFPRDEGPRGLRDEPLSGRWSGEAPYTAHKILVEYTEES